MKCVGQRASEDCFIIPSCEELQNKLYHVSLIHPGHVMLVALVTWHHLIAHALRADLTKRVLGARLAKPPELRLSDWEARPLSPAQASYAALDAFACLRIHEARLPCPDVTDTCMACGCTMITATVRQKLQQEAGASVGYQLQVQLKGMGLNSTCIVMQALQQLPVLPEVVSARAAAATAAAARADNRQHEWPGDVADADEAAEDLVPAVPAPLRLQPAKQAVYSAVHEQVQLPFELGRIDHRLPRGLRLWSGVDRL